MPYIIKSILILCAIGQACLTFLKQPELSRFFLAVLPESTAWHNMVAYDQTGDYGEVLRGFDFWLYVAGGVCLMLLRRLSPDGSRFDSVRLRIFYFVLFGLLYLFVVLTSSIGKIGG